MKKAILVFSFVTGMTAVSFAQAPSNKEMAASRAKAIQTACKLTDDQTAKIAALYEKLASKGDSIRQANNGDITAMRAAIIPIRDSVNSQIKALLTNEQKMEYDNLLATMRSGRTSQ